MDSPWIRAKDIPDYYSISRWKGYELERLFRTQADPADYIKDGKIDSEALEIICYDPISSKYRLVKESVADAFKCGASLK